MREGLPRTYVVFGLMLLLETGKSFLWVDGAPNPVNLRLRALQFANEVQSSIKPIFDAEVNAGIHRNIHLETAYLLKDVTKWLDAFMKTA